MVYGERNILKMKRFKTIIVGSIMGGAIGAYAGSLVSNMVDASDLWNKAGGWVTTGMFQVLNLGAGLISNYTVDSLRGR